MTYDRSERICTPGFSDCGGCDRMSEKLKAVNSHLRGLAERTGQEGPRRIKSFDLPVSQIAELALGDTVAGYKVAVQDAYQLHDQCTNNGGGEETYTDEGKAIICGADGQAYPVEK